jgi:hypothetical protein
VREVRPADPPVEPEQLDAVRLAAEHAFTELGQVELPIAFHEPVRPLAERGEGAEEPGVAEERRVFAPL